MTPERLFGLLSDPTRLRALMLIAAERELCVCELTHALNESQPKVSRHLALLRELGAVNARREGTWMHYALNPDMADWAETIIATTVGTAGQLETFQADRERLHKMAARPEESHCG